MPPAAFLLIDNLQHRPFSRKLGDIPFVRIELFAVSTDGCTNNFSINQQIDAGFVFEMSAADEKPNDVSFDGKFRRCQCARQVVIGGVRVDQLLAGKARNRLLIAELSGCRTFFKSLPNRSPRRKIFAFEIGKDDVRSRAVRFSIARLGLAIKNLGSAEQQ